MKKRVSQLKKSTKGRVSSRGKRVKKQTPLSKKRPVCASRVIPDVPTQMSPNLAWIYPYLKKAQKKMPNLKLPKMIRPFKPSHSRVMRVLGNAYFETRKVVLATHTQVTYLDRKGNIKIRKIVRLPKAKILDTLAHEIAHLEYGEHGYEHKEYTRMIFKTFDLRERCPHCRGTGKIHIESKP